MRKTIGIALTGLLTVSGTGAWASNCATPGDMAALRTAALQQELMVAAFSCHAIQQYNHFVLAHRAELIESDARLKDFFVRARGGEAGYHTYKTELANASSLRSIRDTDAFCAGAEEDFELAGDPASLTGVIDSHEWRGTSSFAACTAPALETAAATPRTRAMRDDTAHSATGMSAPAPHHRMESDSL